MDERAASNHTDRSEWADQELNVELLRTAVAFDELLTQGVTRADALARLAASPSAPPQFVLDALATVRPASDAMVEATISLSELGVGMELTGDVVSMKGAKLVGAGTQVTSLLIQRLSAFAGTVGVMEPVSVLAPSTMLKRERLRWTTPLVLFVDDEWDVTEAMRVGMRSYEFDVVTAGSADEALEILEQSAVDVVVSDERMPGMSGVRFLAHVREHHPDAERIILTGHASVETSIAAINDAQVFPVPHEAVQRGRRRCLHSRRTVGARGTSCAAGFGAAGAIARRVRRGGGWDQHVVPEDLRPDPVPPWPPKPSYAPTTGDCRVQLIFSPPQAPRNASSTSTGGCGHSSPPTSNQGTSHPACSSICCPSRLPIRSCWATRIHSIGTPTGSSSR